MEPPRGRVLEVVAVTALAAAFFYLVSFRDGTFVYQFHKATTGPYLDEGARLAAGEAPYRDFAPRATPGMLFLNAAVVRLFGARLDAMAAAALATGCALAAVLHTLATALVRGPWRFAPAAVFVLLVFPPADLGGHKWPALLLAAGAARALCAHPPSLRALAAAGAACGLAVVFSPFLGLAACAGLLLPLALERPPGARQAALVFAAAAISVAAAVALVLSLRAAAPAVLTGWWRAGQPDVWTADPLGRWRVLDVGFLVVTAAGVLAAVRVLRGRAQSAPAERRVACMGLALLAAGLASHVEPYVFAAQGLLLAVLAAAAASRPARTPAARHARRAMAALLAFCVLYAAGALLVWRQRVQPMVRQRFRAGEAWLGARSEELAWLEDQARPSQPVFVFPAGGASYFLTATRNATSFSYMVEGVATEAQQEQALAEIDARRPAVGVWMGRQRAARRPSLDRLREGLARRYVVERTLPDGTELLRRRPQGAAP